MNRKDIIRMAREAGSQHQGELFVPDAFVLRFAALVAAAEREACAKVCDGWLHANGDDCAASIRARGEQEEPR